MDEIKLDEAKAKAWISDVTNEIELVSKVLKDTSEVLTTVPTDGDTIFTGIRNAGKTLENNWDKLIKSLKDVSTAINDSIEKIIMTVRELKDQIDDIDRKNK